MSSDHKPKRPKFKRYLPPNPLAALVARAGGISRDQAIAEASRRVEALRGPNMLAIGILIGQLEAAAHGRQEPQKQAKEILYLADQIITLADTYNLAFLADATKRLCDLIKAFAASGSSDAAAIAVHIRAIQLFAPDKAPLPEATAQTVLLELQRVRQYFEVGLRQKMSDAGRN